MAKLKIKKKKLRNSKQKKITYEVMSANAVVDIHTWRIAMKYLVVN